MGMYISLAKLVRILSRSLQSGLIALAALCLTASPALASAEVVISEFMADPHVNITDADGEWIELYNRGNDAVDLTGWELNGVDIIAIGGSDLIVAPGQLFVVCLNVDASINGGIECDAAWDGSDAQLANDGGTIELRDDSDNLIDSLVYEEADVSSGQSTVTGKTKHSETVLTKDDLNAYDNPQNNNTGTPGTPNAVTANVNPIFECWLPQADGLYTAYFGYENYNGTPVSVPFGAANTVTPSQYESYFPQSFGYPTDGPRPGRTPFFPDAAVVIPDWDGQNIVWSLTDQDTVTAGLNGPRCDTANAGTLLDAVIKLEELENLEEAAGIVLEYCTAVGLLDADPLTELTVFAPINEAFGTLPVAELEALLKAPDELCELISYHIHDGGAIGSSDIISATVIGTMSGTDLLSGIGDNELSIDLNEGDIILDGNAKVVATDITAFNGVAHGIDNVLLPKNPLLTLNDDLTAGLSGVIDTENETIGSYITDLCLIVRVDGIAHNGIIAADGTWSLPEDSVDTRDLTDATLISLILRTSDDAGCGETAEQPVSITAQPRENGASLLALTMQRLDIPAPETPDEAPGQVLAETDTKPPLSPVASASCGKGLCPGDGGNPTPTDTGNDAGNDDSQDVGSGLRDQDRVDTTETEWYWWFIGGGTVALLWYILWRRPETA